MVDASLLRGRRVDAPRDKRGQPGGSRIVSKSLAAVGSQPHCVRVPSGTHGAFPSWVGTDCRLYIFEFCTDSILRRLSELCLNFSEAASGPEAASEPSSSTARPGRQRRR